MGPLTVYVILPPSLPPPLPPSPPFPPSYEQALQALADSEAKRETSDKEMKLVSKHVVTPASLVRMCESILTL